MRIISFSDVRFVRAILEKKKVQTIRPLFCKSCPHEGIPVFKSNKPVKNKAYMIDKPEDVDKVEEFKRRVAQIDTYEMGKLI